MVCNGVLTQRCGVTCIKHVFIISFCTLPSLLLILSKEKMSHLAKLKSLRISKARKLISTSTFNSLMRIQIAFLPMSASAKQSKVSMMWLLDVTTTQKC